MRNQQLVVSFQAANVGHVGYLDATMQFHGTPV